MFWHPKVFQKTDNCIDLLSFDPGIVNGGVVHLRVDKLNKRFCVLHTALLNIRDPFVALSTESIAAKQARGKRSQKPIHVEPFSGDAWPMLDFVARQSVNHVAKLAEFNSHEEPKFEHQMALLPFALHSADWLDGSDENLDAVLVEVQDPQNPKMRALGHSVQTFYENVNARGRAKMLRVEYVSSRLKLSEAVLGVLADNLRFEANEAQASLLQQNLSELVSTRSHAAKKSSAVQVFKAFDSAAPADNCFFAWARGQRNTKHNIFDALLQALSWLLQEAIGFESGLLNGRRQTLQKQRAKKRRMEEKQSTNSNSENLSASKKRTKEQRPAESATADDFNVPLKRRCVMIDLS